MIYRLLYIFVYCKAVSRVSANLFFVACRFSSLCETYITRLVVASWLISKSVIRIYILLRIIFYLRENV